MDPSVASSQQGSSTSQQGPSDPPHVGQIVLDGRALADVMRSAVASCGVPFGRGELYHKDARRPICQHVRLKVETRETLFIFTQRCIILKQGRWAKSPAH